MLETLFYFLIAIAILIFVHEYGHYKAALLCGVKVERFAIGFGKPLLTWKKAGSDTQFVVGMLPLGGYVKMVDEREGAVKAEDLPFAFNRKSLAARSLIVLAGPLANLALAVLLYACVNWIGQTDAKPVLASTIPGSVAHIAGVQAGDLVIAVGRDATALDPIQGYAQLSWQLTRAVFQERPVFIEVLPAGERTPKVLELKPMHNDTQASSLNPLVALGLRGVLSAPVLSHFAQDGAAKAAGLQDGDRVLSVDGKNISDAAMLRDLIGANNSAPPIVQVWRIQRGDRELSVDVRPKRVMVDGKAVGRIGSAVGGTVEYTTVRYGVLDGFWNGVVQTYEMAHLSVTTLAKMLIGQASLEHLSGPLSIAEYAGKTADRGFENYLLFLAVISVSLGVLNLLPIPVLDGGHLMYYLWEGITGKPVSERIALLLQQVGTGVIVILMGIGMFNDVTRIFSRFFAN